jgi:hypothetical protein
MGLLRSFAQAGPPGYIIGGKKPAKIVREHHYYVQYRVYIPADHLVTTVPCYQFQKRASPIPDLLFPPFNDPLGVVEVLGDASAFSTQFRIKEYVNVSTNGVVATAEPDLTKLPSTSYNFEVPSTIGNIVSADFNPNSLYLCFHEQSTGSANMNDVGGWAASGGANDVSVSFNGSASDPLFKNPVAPIQFDLTVTINAETNMASIVGNHTCFPSHEIVIGSQVVYRRDPAYVDFLELSYCLIAGMGGLAETNVNCTVPLDGVSMCPN